MSKIIGTHYEVPDDDDGILGKGGMGTVLLATDTRTGQRVAIKQLKQEITLDNPDFVERFNREAEAIRRLNHPNIIAVLETFDENNQHYLVMDYVDGGSLEDLLAQETILPVERVLLIALDLADALTRAHRLQIVHRDIKPANVLLMADGTPRLTDFGVAHIEDKTRVTQTGAVVGTLNYMSPETLNGQKTDARADIWAFGIMLYEMLAGRRPFDEETTTSLITAILTKPVTNILELRPDIPQALADLVHRMLEKDLDQRIDSVRKIGTAIEDIIRGTDSDELNLDSEFVHAIKQEQKSRFAPTTPDENRRQHALQSHMGMTMVKSDTGEEYVMMSKQSALRIRQLVIALVIFAVAIGIGLTTLVNNKHDDETVEETVSTPGDRGNPILQQEVDEGNFAVAIIVPEMSPDNSQPRTMDILQDLEETLQRDIPYSNIQPLVFMLDADSEDRSDIGRFMSESGSVLMVMLREDEDGLTANIQTSDLSVFSYNQFDSDLLKRMVEVEVKITDLDTQSLAPHIINAMAVLHSADGNVFEFMRMISMLSDMEKDPAEVVGGGVNTDIANYFANYFSDKNAALAAIKEALDTDGGNPILYVYSAFINLQLNTSESWQAAERDAVTAERIGPDGWTMPQFIEMAIEAVNPTAANEALETLDDALAERDNADWFLLSIRAQINLVNGNYDEVLADAQKAMALDPQANYAHVAAFVSALHEGQITYAGDIMAELVKKFPDPNFGNRVLSGAYGEFTNMSAGMFSATANLIIGQYQTVITETNTIATLTEMLPDEHEAISNIFLIRGMAYCNMGDYDSALEAYTTGLAYEPNYHMLHLLASEIYVRQADMEAANAAAQAAFGLNDEMDAFVMQLVTQDTIDADFEGCGDFFDGLQEFEFNGE